MTDDPTERDIAAWRCGMHGVPTTGDCPRCDDELIALTDESQPRFQDPCFYCRRGMHDSCISGEIPCRCCGEAS